MRNVSITLQNNADALPIIEAVIADNPTAEAHYYPAMVKIDAPGQLVVNRESIEERMGREFDLQELHLSLVSLAGNIDEDDDTFTLAWS